MSSSASPGSAPRSTSSGSTTSLEPRAATRELAGELWAIHGGGFYRAQKFKLAPDALPATLHWFKWEAYWTWITGFALLALMYYAQRRALPHRSAA